MGAFARRERIPERTEHIFAKDDFSKADVKRFLFEHARVPLLEFPTEMGGEGALGKPLHVIDGMVVPCESAADIMIVVAGGHNPYHLVALPTFDDTRAVTKVIEATC